MSLLLEFSMSPLGKGESVSQYVARSLEIIGASGLPYRINPMGTVIEGEWEECIRVVGACLERMAVDCNRVTCSIKIDYRKGPAGRLKSKIAKVEKVLGKPLSQ